MAGDLKAEGVVLAIHGGAGVLSREIMTPEAAKEYHATLEQALRAGRAALEKNDGTSLDAVVAAIRVMEDSPLFNAGRGAAFTRDGRNELDAAIIDGRNRRAGAVAAVTTVKNPIEAARLVMEKSPHVLLVSAGADNFARQHGAEIVDPSYFRTELRWKMLQEKLRREKTPSAPGQSSRPAAGADAIAGHAADMRFGTVGCVAVDRHRNLAAGTSTGGLTGKLAGRLGDSPLIGAGTFADNDSCAVSATGDGEYFIRAAAAHDIAAMVEYKGLSVAEAGRAVIDKIKRAGGEGGVIVLDRKGNLGMSYSSEGMYRGYVTRKGEVQVKIYE
jgi:beta-aspartyl-peptidase (threonine type)